MPTLLYRSSVLVMFFFFLVRAVLLCYPILLTSYFVVISATVRHMVLMSCILAISHPSVVVVRLYYFMQQNLKNFEGHIAVWFVRASERVRFFAFCVKHRTL